MTPYYDDGLCVIYHGDCLDVLGSLSDVGLVLTSPPYNLRCPDAVDPFGHGGVRNANAGGVGTYFGNLADGYGEHGDNMAHVDYVAWQRSVLTACWAALADDGAIFYQHKPIVRGNRARLPFELVPDDLPLRQIVTWDRGSGFMRVAPFYVPRYEWILILAREAFRLTSRNVDDVWAIPFETGAEHPAPFPLGLARRALATTSAELVLDPFMGSGTTLRAAKDLGRRAIGVEVEERYCEIAARRLDQQALDFGGGVA